MCCFCRCVAHGFCAPSRAVKTLKLIARSAHPSCPFVRGSTEVCTDSPLEGDGFEPSVPVKDQLVETVLFDFPAEARKRTIGGRRSQPRDLGGDIRRDPERDPLCQRGERGQYLERV